MRVLVTGGAGFIGSHLCDALISNDYEVTILDNLSTGSKKNIAHLEMNLKIYQGDIRDQNLVESLVEKSDLVFHMAAVLGVDNILTNPIDSISVNYHGSEIVLNSAAKYDKRIIIASTSEIYGKNPKQPLSEIDDRVIGTPQKLRWSYSDAKALEEASAFYLYLTKKLKVTIIRFFNTVGPRQTGKYGMVIPRFIEAAVSNKPIRIFGDGTQSRVFCHVEDAVQGIISLVRDDRSIGQVFNLGGTGEISINDLAKIILEKTSSYSKIEYIPYDQAYSVGFEEMKRRVPDISKIHELTGWKPTKVLEEIIDDIVSSIF